MLFSELRKKEVINTRNCKRLGNVEDLELDECTGQIHKLIVSDGFHLCSLFTCPSDIAICYKDIKQIGPDIILVDLCGR